MFLMSYGYNPTIQKPIDPGTPGGTTVDPVTPPPAAQTFVTTELVRAAYGRQLERRQRPGDSRRIGDYLGTIQRRVADTNRRFAQQGLAYRFAVRAGQGRRVMLDLEALDSEGTVVSTKSRDITNEEFGRVMDDISSGTGLVIDSLPAARAVASP